MVWLIFLWSTRILLAGFVGWRSLTLIDPDFGWHLRLGELILDKGPWVKVPFSYVWPDFAYVPNSWLYDGLIALVLRWGGPEMGWYVVSGMTMACVMATFYLAGKASLLKIDRLAHLKAQIILLLTGLLVVAPFVGNRPQIFSWLFFSGLLALLTRPKPRLWPILALFFIWTQMHGGFVFGLGILAIFVVSRVITKTFSWQNGLLWLGSTLLITIINPYGLLVHKEILLSILDSQLRFRVSEWVPMLFHLEIVAKLGLFVALTLATALAVWQKLGLFERILLLILPIIGMSGARMFPLFIIGYMHLWMGAYTQLTTTIGKNGPAHYKRVFQHLIHGIIFIMVGIAVCQMYFSYKEAPSLRESAMYPQRALQAIDYSPDKGRILNPFYWSGYILWHYPTAQTFADGRMPSWYMYGPNDPFSQLDEIVYGLSRRSPQTQIPPNPIRLDKYEIRFIIWPIKDKRAKPFLDMLAKHGWRRIYADETTVVYEK